MGNKKGDVLSACYATVKKIHKQNALYANNSNTVHINQINKLWRKSYDAAHLHW